MAKDVVVIGAGAREHGLVRSLAASGARVFASPGNGGIADDASIIAARSAYDIRTRFHDSRPLVVIGPEAYLAEGWADYLRGEGFPVVGPSMAAARLESSKRFSKAVMQQCGIPTAAANTAHSADELEKLILRETHWPKVMKQSGLAQGKGVSIVTSRQDALEVLAEWRQQLQIWADGVLLEDYLEGFEISVLVVTNGREYEWFPVAQDYKRLSPDSESPNTGGMGAIAPLALPPTLIEQINHQVFDPLMQYFEQQHLDYRGVLYAGLMVTATGPIVLEFNVRLGDPETQVVIPILDIDWYAFWLAVSQGEVPRIPQPQRSAVGVVMVASGYPQSPKTGMFIRLGQDLSDTIIYHAATARTPGGWESRGGRVLTVVGLGGTLDEARSRAYGRVAAIQFPDSYYRPDIGSATRT